MGWAAPHIEKLRRGETVSFRPRGHSMRGRIASGQLCTAEPLGERPAAVGEIVLCEEYGHDDLHLVKATQGGRYLIGNNRGGTSHPCSP